MPFVQAKCPECGGMLAVDDSKKTANCQFCGEAFIVQEAINNYNTYNTYNNDNRVSHNYGDGAVINVYEDKTKDFVIECGVLKKYQGASVDVVIPDGVIELGEECFKDLKIKSVNISDSVTSIAKSAFYGCKNLTSITIPDSVTSIAEYAFYGCENLISITIPDSVTSIGESAFWCCNNFTSISIPSSVTSIGEHAFLGCFSLTYIDVDNNNRNYFSLNGVLFDKEITELIECPRLKTGEIYVLPDTVKYIHNCAFAGCKNLTSITIPDSVISIGEHAFLGCESLKSITIPNIVTSIGNYAFSNCVNLCDVNISHDLFVKFESAFPVDLYKQIVKQKEEAARIKEEAKRKVEIQAKERAEAERLAKLQAEQTEKLRIISDRKNKGLCQYCGGTFKGLFSSKCSNCGKSKDY